MRFWSPEQKYLLEVLKKTGCMRKSQALTLLHRQFGTSQNAIGPICRQLRDAGYLREFDGVISAVGPQYEPFIPNAIDLILAIFPRELPTFERTARNSLYALGTQSGLLARVFFSRGNRKYSHCRSAILSQSLHPRSRFCCWRTRRRPGAYRLICPVCWRIRSRTEN